MVADYFPGMDPLGKAIRLTSDGKESDPALHGLFEIVGVVQDVKNRGIQERPVPHVYLSGATTGRAVPAIFVRTSGDPIASLNAVRGEIAIVDRQVALRQPGALEEVLQRSFYSQPRFSLIVLGVFAVTGTLLVAMGVFSVMAYTVTRQTREIAVRMALGAGRGHVMGVVLRSGAQLLALGVAAGLLGNFATSRLIASQLWNTSPNDPVTLAAAVSIISRRGVRRVLHPGPARDGCRPDGGAATGLNKDQRNSTGGQKIRRKTKTPDLFSCSDPRLICQPWSPTDPCASSTGAAALSCSKASSDSCSASSALRSVFMLDLCSASARRRQL